MKTSTRSGGPLAGMFLAGAMALAAPAMAATNLVANGSFETGDLTGWSGTLLASPFSGVVCPGAGTAPDGICELFAGTNGTAESLTQLLNTIAGQAYTISFTLQSDGSVPSSFSAAFGTQGLASLTSPVVGTTSYSFISTAVGSSTALSFNLQNDAGYFVLDGVTVSAVPEPTTLTLSGLGIVGLLAVRRKVKAA